MAEQFINVYVDLLNASFVDAVNKNLILQAQQKVAEMELASLKEINEKNISESLELNSLRNQLSATQNDLIVSKNATQHLESFKAELIKAREEIKEKSKQLETLNSELRVSKEQNEDKGIKLDILNSQIIKSKQEIEEKNIKLDILISELESVKKVISDLSFETEKLKQENLELNKDNIKMRKDLQKFEENVTEEPSEKKRKKKTQEEQSPKNSEINIISEYKDAGMF